MSSRATGTDRNSRNVTHQKQARMTYAKGQPSINDLKEGVPVIREVGGQIIQFTKINGRVFKANLEEQAPSGVTFGSAFPAPGYDSGWIEISNGNNYNFDHNLGSQFLMVQTYIKGKSTNSGEIFNVTNAFTYEQDTGDADDLIGLSFFMENANRINVGAMNTHVFVHDNTSASTTTAYTEWTDGYLRIFAWTFGATE